MLHIPKNEATSTITNLRLKSERYSMMEEKTFKPRFYITRRRSRGTQRLFNVKYLFGETNIV